MSETKTSACCAASRPMSSKSTKPKQAAVAPTTNGSTKTMLLLPGGEFLMGTEDRRGFSADGEGPIRKVRLDPFYIDVYAVTNAQFEEFVKATGCKTEAERFGWSFVFCSFR